MKTWFAKSEDSKKWWLIDATDRPLGRLATEVVNILRGKNKPSFTPFADTGDFVVVVNAEKIKLSGNKMEDKLYYRHSRFFGGLKELTATEMLQSDPEYVIREAVEGMLPDNRLSRRVLKKLKAYGGPNHPHKAQKPEAYTFTK